MTAFDIKKLNEIVYKNSSESDIRVLLMAITFLATNFIRRVCEIPEIVYN